MSKDRTNFDSWTKTTQMGMPPSKVDPSFEYCAFKFLEQWLEWEKPLFEVISVSPTSASIRAALKYFVVSRNFPRLEETENQDVILRSLRNALNNPDLVQPHEKVNALAASFEERFKRRNLSAASKLLWLSQRSPFVIYDSRAVKALGAGYGDYLLFATAWAAQYKLHESAIENAMKALPDGLAFLRKQPGSHQEFSKMISEPWFRERVFDTYLWVKGE